MKAKQTCNLCLGRLAFCHNDNHSSFHLGVEEGVSLCHLGNRPSVWFSSEHVDPPEYVLEKIKLLTYFFKQVNFSLSPLFVFVVEGEGAAESPDNPPATFSYLAGLSAVAKEI